MLDINHIAPLLETLRRRSVTGGQRIKKQQHIDRQALSHARQTAQNLSHLSQAQLYKLARARLVELDTADIRYYEKAIKAFTELAIIWEYGEAVIGDPNISETINAVYQVIDNNAPLMKQYRLFIDQLTAGSLPET